MTESQLMGGVEVLFSISLDKTEKRKIEFCSVRKRDLCIILSIPILIANFCLLFFNVDKYNCLYLNF